MIYPSKSDQLFAKDTNNTTPYNFVPAQPLVLLNIKIIHMDISLSSITDPLVIANSRRKDYKIKNLNCRNCRRELRLEIKRIKKQIHI